MKKLFTLLIMAILATATSFAETKTGSWDLTTASDDWEATGNATYFSQPYGYKAANGTLTNSAISDFSTSGITQIKVGFKCLQNGGTTSKITIYLVDSEGKPLGNGMVVTPKNASAASQTAYSYATFTSGLTGATGFMMKVTTFGKNILVNGAEYEVTYGQQKQDPNISFSSSTHIAEIGKTNTFPTLTNSNNVPVTYSSSNTNVATIDPSTGAITLLSDGSTTIKASFSGDDTYSSAETSYTLLVRDNTVTPDVAQTIALNNAFWGTSYSDTFNPPANSLVLTGSKYGVAISLANGSSTAGYINDAQTRAYNGYTMSFTAPEGYVLKKITFTADGSNWQGEHTADAGSMTDNKHWLGSASAVTISFKGSCRIVSVDVTYEKASAPTPVTLASIAVSDPKTAFTVGDTFEFGGVVTATYDDGNTKDVTTDATFSGYDMASAGTQTVTVSYTEGEVTKTTTYDITVSAPVTLVSIAVSGTPTKKEYKDGDAFDPEGLVVTGTYSDASTAPITEGIEWTITPATLTAGTTSVSVVAKAGEKTSEEYTVTGLTVTEKPATVEDYIVADDLSATESSYTDFSNVKKNTAIYAGNTARGNDAIQLRSTNSNSGIVSTTSGGKIKKVVVTWNSNTASDRTLNVYGSNVAFTSATELYNAGSGVTKIGSIVKGTSTELEISDDYTYVGVRSNSGAMYLDGIKFVWDTTPEQVKTLDHITLSGTYQTTFYVGDTFNHEGMTVTASYAEEGVADADVTKQATFSTPDMSQAGTQTVTVSYTEGEVTKTATYTITIKKKSARAYTLVTSQDDIVDGGEYIILSEDGNYAAAVGTNNRIETEARGENTYKIVDNTVIVSSYSITRPYFLVATDGGWYINDGEYNASLSEKTHVDFVKDKQDVFTVSIAADNTAKITAPAVAADRQIAYHYWIKQNTTDVVERAFRYYASSKVGTAEYQAIKLYKRVNTVVIEDGYRSKYNESTERNLYKNTLTYDVPKANDELKLYRGTTLLGTFTVDATNENYTFTPENAFDADQTNRFDDEPVVLTGNVDNGLTITDYYSEFIEANMPEAVRYSLRDADDVEVGVAVVPLYRSVASARVMMDPANNIEGYTADDIVNDNAHAANYQNNVRVDVAHADIDGLSGIKVYRDQVVAGEAGATAEYVDVLGKEVRLSNIFESELAVTSAYGENTYGSPKATVHAALVAIEAHDKEVSKYSFTTAGGKTGHYFSVLADVKLNQPEDGEFELVGVRAWRTCNSSLEPIEQLAGRSNDYNYATILDTETFAAIEGNEVKNIGSEKISYEDAGTKLEFGSGVFGSSANLPTVSLRVRAYYRRAAQSSAAPMMKAPAAAGNYYVAEAFAEVTFTADVPTGVLDVAGAKEVKSVRYFNIMGVESAEPVDGVNIVVTTYTDGTSSSAKMLR